MPAPTPSILYPPGYPRPDPASAAQPASFPDLNLDQVVHAVTAGRTSYNLAGYYHSPLRSGDAVGYRHEVCRRLQQPDVRTCLDRFADGMRATRDQLARAADMRYPRQRQRWLLDAADTYRTAVRTIATQLPYLNVGDGGLRSIADYLTSYAASPPFTALNTDVDTLMSELAAIRYCVQLHAGRVTVTRDAGEADYGLDIGDTFVRFRHGAAADHHIRFATTDQMNHVEAGILDAVARLWPDTFAALANFAEVHAAFAEPAVLRFDRETQFYLSWLDHVGALSRSGLGFCYPDMDTGKHVEVTNTFDVALTTKLAADGRPVVRNDIILHGPERIAVVTGANQGGKTTFARTFGQLHYLASLGLPVPGRRARLPLADGVFTHFEKQERPDNLRGKLEDDLQRIRDILGHATADSVVILNEVFTSTTAADAEQLGRRILQRLIDLDALGVYVTFIDELSTISPAVASLVATVDPADPVRRTFVIRRQPADGRAYADTLADHYGLSYPRLRHRLAS